MLYNNISGTTLDATTRLKFNMFDSDKCFLTFCKSDLTWGNCSLISISTPANKKISQMLNGFVDKNTSGYSEQTSKIRIYRTPANIDDFTTDLSEYQFISELANIDLYLEHINDNWCSIKGLPYDYSQYLKNTIIDGGETYKWKYYIIPSELYEQTPASVDNIVKINDKTFNKDSMYTENVNLVYVSDNDSETIVARNLSKSTSLLGEVFIYGLDENSLSTNVPDLAQKVNNDMIISQDRFYLSDMKNKKVSDYLYLQSYNDVANDDVYNYIEDEKYLLFKSKKQYTDTVLYYYTKISTNISSTELAIYNENLNFLYPTVTSSNDVSDSNPPAFDVSYLSSDTFDRSLFEVKGYSRIKKSSDPALQADFISKISYVKMLKSNEEKLKYESYGFNINSPTNNKTFEIIQLKSTEPVLRYGNIKPKPNNSAYTANDVRFWIWDLEFLVGDVVNIKPDINNASVLERVIVDVNYEEDYVILNNPLGVSDITTLEFLDINFNKNASQIKLKNTSNILSEVKYAVCDNLDDAYYYNMDSILIDIQISGSSTMGESSGIYEGLYRQIAITYNPKYLDITNENSSLWELKSCDGDFYSDTTAISLFNHLNHRYENGTVLYLANKSSIWRKYINGMETFKLVI